MRAPGTWAATRRASRRSVTGARRRPSTSGRATRRRTSPDFLAVIDFDQRSRTMAGCFGRYRCLRPATWVTSRITATSPRTRTSSPAAGCSACSRTRTASSSSTFRCPPAGVPVLPRAAHSTITDDFLALPDGGFLVTQMGSATAEHRVASPSSIATSGWSRSTRGPAPQGFNPHGISARFDLNLLVTSDFINPASTLNVWPGPIELRGALRVWNLARRKITRTVYLPEALGTMDVKLIPGDPHGRAVTANMFSGFVYTVDPTDGSVVQSFDCEEIVPHVECQSAAAWCSSSRCRARRPPHLRSFEAGQVGHADISDRNAFSSRGRSSTWAGSGPHDIDLSDDDSRLVVTDYFLNEDGFGKVHGEGDHKVHVFASPGAPGTRSPVRAGLQHGIRIPGSATRDRDEVRAHYSWTATAASGIHFARSALAA